MQLGKRNVCVMYVEKNEKENSLYKGAYAVTVSLQIVMSDGIFRKEVPKVSRQVRIVIN